MIQVINRALDILELIARQPDQPKVLGEIAGTLQLNSATCANIIKTLVDRKYLEKMDRQRGYCLGPMAYGLSGNEGYQKGMIDAARDEMESLTKKLNENSLLCILKGDIRVVVLRIQSNNELQANTANEKRAYDAASGRLLLAMMEDEELDRFIDKYELPTAEEWEGANDIKGFYRQVNKIRTQGYAMQVTRNQIVGIALPLYKDNKVIASLSMYMPASRFNSSDRETIIRLIKRSSEKISKNYH